MKADATDITLILDRSGSMASVARCSAAGQSLTALVDDEDRTWQANAGLKQ